jgi:hypothetical protein
MSSEDTKIAGIQSETLAEVTAAQHRRVLLNTLAAAQQRIAALEQALRAMVEPGKYDDPGWVVRDEDGAYNCAYCTGWDSYDNADGVKHEPNCPVLAARELLGKP